MGCAGALLGVILGTCGLSIVGLITAFGSAPSLQAVTPDPSQPDITITVQEDYFTQMMKSSLPAGWGDNLKLDVQPGNRLALSGKMTATFFGQTLEGDVSATITLDAQDGRLIVQIKDVNVSGFAVSGIGEQFMNDLSNSISQMIDDQVKAGLGQNAYIMSVATDDKQLIIRARWQ
jgi:hypothetical protein